MRDVLHADVRDLYVLWRQELRDVASELVGLATARWQEEFLLASAGGEMAVLRRRGRHIERLDKQSAMKFAARMSGNTRAEPIAKVSAAIYAKQHLVERLGLPSNVRTNLSDAVRFQISSISPFSASDVLYNYKVLEDDAGADTIQLAVTIIPKSVLTEIEACAQRLGFQLDRIGALEDDSELGWSPIDIKLRDSVERARALGGPLVVFAVLVALIGCFIPIWKTNAQIRSLENERTTLGGRFEQVMSANASFQSLRQLGEALQATAAQAPPAALALEELSRILDDGTYLANLKISDSGVSLSGLTTNASSVWNRVSISKQRDFLLL